MQNIVRELPVMLTDEQKLSLGSQLASKEVELGIVQADAKADAAEYRAQVKEIRKTIGELTESIRSGHEKRKVECMRRMNADGNAEIVRLDTNEVVEVEEKSDQESTEDTKQPALPFKQPPALKFWARDNDGELHKISAEQRDAIVNALQTQSSCDVLVEREGLEPLKVVVVALQPNTACDICGLADGNHRADAHAEYDAAEREAEEGGETVDVNGTRYDLPEPEGQEEQPKKRGKGKKRAEAEA